MASVKTKLARRLRSHSDIEHHVPLFDTMGWEIRRTQIAEKIARRQGKAHTRAIERRELTAKGKVLDLGVRSRLSKVLFG